MGLSGSYKEFEEFEEFEKFRVPRFGFGSLKKTDYKQ